MFQISQAELLMNVDTFKVLGATATCKTHGSPKSRKLRLTYSTLCRTCKIFMTGWPDWKFELPKLKSKYNLFQSTYMPKFKGVENRNCISSLKNGYSLLSEMKAAQMWKPTTPHNSLTFPAPLRNVIITKWTRWRLYLKRKRKYLNRSL